MRIIAKTRGMSKDDLYRLISPESFTNMREKAGEVLKVKQFSLHSEADPGGNDKMVVSILTDDNELVVSASRTFTREFERIASVYGANGIVALEVLNIETSMGNDMLSCRLVKTGGAA